METLQPVTDERPDATGPAPAGGDGPGNEERVLMLARVGQDEALAERALSTTGYELVVGREGERLAAEIDAGAGALIVTAEALTPEHLGHLLDALGRQPPWSDLPVLALPQEESASARWTAQAMERLGNVIVLERPLKKSMLVSSVKSALRDRARQYRFRDMLSRLDEVERQRHQFLVDLGHEVRNPLAVIRTSLSLLRELDGEADKRRRQPLELIERQTEQLSRLIDDLLQVTRFNVGRLALERTVTDLAEVVESTLDNFSLLAKAGGGGLDLDIESGEVPVSADPVSLEQMIFHLVRGAIRDTRPGERALLAVRAEENHAVLTVTAGDGGGDGGEASAESELAQSMPIVRNLAELHGGQVEIRHQEGRREVEVRLPRRAQKRGRRRPRKRPKGEALSVLVVEDSPDGREGLTTLLELKSYKVTGAGSGKEALAKVAKAKPEVALVDIGLPDMDGYEVARELRRRFDSQLTLIALTGYGQPDDRRKALEAGFDLHLVKPVDPQQLFDLLSDIAAGPDG